MPSTGIERADDRAACAAHAFVSAGGARARLACARTGAVAARSTSSRTRARASVRSVLSRASRSSHVRSPPAHAESDSSPQHQAVGRRICGRTCRHVSIRARSGRDGSTWTPELELWWQRIFSPNNQGEQPRRAPVTGHERARWSSSQPRGRHRRLTTHRPRPRPPRRSSRGCRHGRARLACRALK